MSSIGITTIWKIVLASHPKHACSIDLEMSGILFKLASYLKHVSIKFKQDLKTHAKEKHKFRKQQYES
jgi:hypothetical protein